MGPYVEEKKTYAQCHRMNITHSDLENSQRYYLPRN
jgi:hypothetical protein